MLQLPFYGSDIAMSNINKIDLNLLIVLDALLDERSVTRAAARLGYTQPTISGMSYALSVACWQLRVHRRWLFH